MGHTLLTHKETKELYLKYRATAQRLFSKPPKDTSDENLIIRVPDHASVQITETGAFVDAHIWIPKGQIE